ncbi:hypothetical protein RND71_017355 [Anisodus tanguticus]|uniref:ABC transporter domain-containing protein n=1 Tax=Anisodus tanguticus TaxID=243964 RepID=A0AAE1S0F0_9SOLA|nr:hypothetical protein RND71_017355 [Anisodus tanguticus]
MEILPGAREHLLGNENGFEENQEIKIQALVVVESQPFCDHSIDCGNPLPTLFLDGQTICDLDVLTLRRKIGMLFQLPVLFEGTVADNVRYGPQLKGKKLSDNEVLLLDEPTSALDPISTQNIEDVLVKLKREQNMTIVMVSQSIKQIKRIADIVYLLVNGEIVEILKPDTL